MKAVKRPRLQNVAEFLDRVLPEGTRMPLAELLSLADSAFIARPTLRAAYAVFGIYADGREVIRATRGTSQLIRCSRSR
jgi:hypothetical protein